MDSGSEAVRLTELRRGTPVEADPDGVFPLRTGSDYLLTLPADAPTLDATDPRRRWVTMLEAGPPMRVRLDLGAFVGTASLFGLSFRVTSPLLTDGDFERMTADIARFAPALPFVEPSPTVHRAAPAPADPDPGPLCHRLALLHGAFGAGLPPWMHEIARRPAVGRRLDGAEIDPGRLAGEPVRAAALVADGRWSAVAPGTAAGRTAVARRSGGVLPVAVPVTVGRLDPASAPANRGLAAMRAVWRSTAVEARQMFRWNGSLVAQADRVLLGLAQLDRLLPWLDGVRPTGDGSPTATIWSRHPGYRAALTLHLNLHRPLGPFAWDVLVGLRDGAALYEAWTFVTLRDALSARCGSPTVVDGPVLRSTPTGVGLRRGVALGYPTGHVLHYNPTYAAPSSSYSLAFRPDLAIERPDGGRHLLDAKFRDDPADELAKMHAYRDAIRDVRSVWAVHPGAGVRLYPADGSGRLDRLADLTADPTGVGLVPLHPDRRTDFLGLIDRLL